MKVEKGIYKHSDNKYEARIKIGVNDSGRAIYKSVYAKTIEGVKEKRRQIVGDEEERLQWSTDMNLLILGAGSHGRDVYEIAESLHMFNKIRFLDDNVEGELIIDTCKNLYKYRREYSCIFVAIGDNNIRKRYAKLIKEYKYLMPSIVSPMANISTNAEIGKGVAILPMARIGDAKIGDFCIVASNGLVNTDAVVEDYCHVDSGSIIKKAAKVREGIWVRSGEIVG